MSAFPKRPTGIVLTVPGLDGEDSTNKPIKWCGLQCELVALESLRAKSTLAEAVRFRKVLEWIRIALETGIYDADQICQEIDWAFGKRPNPDTNFLAWGDCLGLQARKRQP